MGTLNKLHKESLRERRVEGIKKAATEEWEQKALDTLARNFAITPELAKKIKDYGGYIPWSSETIYMYTQKVALLEENNKLIRASKDREIAERDRTIAALDRLAVVQQYVLIKQTVSMADLFAANAFASKEKLESLAPEVLLPVLAMSPDTNPIQLALNTGADVNAFSHAGTGLLPLSAAALTGPVDTMRILLDKGAKVNAKRGDMTALSWAAWSKSLEKVELLLDRGAYINVNANSPIACVRALSPLKIAEHREAWDIVKLLKSRGAKGKLMLETKRILRAMK
jgi:hypothetical protein